MSYLSFLIYMHDTIIIGELISYLSFLIYMHDTIIIGGLMSC